MKPSTHAPLSHAQLTSTGTSDVKSATILSPTAAVLIGVETNDARITFDGSTPSSSNGLIFPKGAVPVMVLVGQGHTIQVVSTAAGNSVVDICYLQ